MVCLAGPLPDFPPGALQRLQQLRLIFPGLRSTLPPSWGANPAILPALEELHLTAGVEGVLPASWGVGGFRHLTSLEVVGVTPGLPLDSYNTVDFASSMAAQPGWQQPVRKTRRESAALAGGPPSCLPPAWAAAGAFPKLLTLVLINLGLTGTLPTWLPGAWRKLQSL